MRVYHAPLLSGGLAKARQLSRGSKLSRNVRQVLWLGTVPKIAFSIGARILRLAGQPQLAESAAYCGKQYAEALERRTHLWRTFIGGNERARIDAILCPVFAVPALRHRVNRFINEGLSYTALYNFLGMPAGVVAASRVRSGEESERTPSFNLPERAARKVETGSLGLPVGVQVVARPWREDIALAIMSVLGDAFDKYVQRVPRWLLF